MAYVYVHKLVAASLRNVPVVRLAHIVECGQ